MNVEVITIGNELLIGQVIDTNSAWMGQKLNGAGFDVTRITSVQDTREAISNSLKEALLRTQIVLLTGGLGPTKDDITKETLADFFKTKLVFNETVYSNIASFLKGRVKGINKLNKDQAYVPENCEVINNPIGTAPVMWFEKDGKVIVSMPGVPDEMKAAMNSEIIPRLKERFTSSKIIHKTIQLFNISEAVLAEQLEEWELTKPDYISIAYLPSPSIIRLRITAKTKDEEQANKAIASITKRLYEIVGEHIFGEEDKPANEMLGEVLLKKGRTLAVAESCTGGHIGHLITRTPGSSSFFIGGVIAYKNAVKKEVLKVKEVLLKEHGAVNKEVVEQMAIGVKKLMCSDYAIATSGIAGPAGGTDEKPVGTVWIGIAGDFGVLSQCYNFGKIRIKNIQRSSDMALIMLLKKLVE